ncbi:MAG: hypothetical protein GC159_05975 [Phycisphaera sp.]|nr:hypothetical protein [Phycisphaera sp.]
MQRFLAMLVLSAAGLSAVGCGPIKVPDFPPALVNPTVTVTSVQLMDQSPEASRYMVHVLMENPNAYELPLTDAKYTLSVSGAEFKGDIPPNRTLPASRKVEVLLPAAVSAAPSDSYSITGSIEMAPRHEMRKLLYDLGFPMPRVHFSGQGPVGPPGAGDVPAAASAEVSP